MQGVRYTAGKLLCAFSAPLLLVFAAPVEGFEDIPPRCKFKDGVVTIDPGYWQPTVERRGDRIVPTYTRGAIKCKPAAPTIDNTDTIAMTDESTIDFRGGPFAPGASPEADGSPEIEFEISEDGYPIDLLFGNGDDHVTAGVIEGGSIGLNLNPSQADIDADILLRSEELGFSNVTIHAGGGDDLIDAGGGPGFAPRTKVSIGFLFGDAGNDTLIGTDDFDLIEGGGGTDRVDGRMKPDLIRTRDKSSDIVACGSGRDTLYRDRRDRGTDCERNYLPGQEPPDPKPPNIPGLNP